MANQDTIITPNQFNVKSLEHTKFETQNKDAKMKTCLINYKYPKIDKPFALSVRIDEEFTLSLERGGGGLPPIHETYAPTNDKRQYIKIPLVPDDPASDQLRNIINKYMTHLEENREKILGKDSKYYEIYSPIAQKVEMDASDDEDKKQTDKKSFPKYDTVKLRLVADRNVPGFNYTDPVTKTRILVKNPDTKKLHLLEHPKIDDINEYLGLGSKFKIVFGIQRLSGTLTPDPKTKKRTCYVILTLKQLVITEKKTQGGNAKDQFSSSAFPGDEMENEEVVPSAKLSELPVCQDVVKQSKVNLSEETSQETKEQSVKEQSDSSSSSDSENSSVSSSPVKRAKPAVRKLKKA